MKYPSFSKQASDDQLESAFFQLAYDKLQSTLKNLLPNLIGFEIVKKNEDNTKGLGIFGFRSSSGQILYVPAFFVNGKVKNLDLLYSKNNEQFYPLNEDFAEMFLKDELLGLGSNSGENKADITKDVQQGDYRQMTVPPRTGKYSIASCLDYVEEADTPTKVAFANLIESDAEFCEAVARFYPIEKIAKAIAVRSDSVGNAKKSKGVEVFYKKDVEKAKALAPEKKKEVMTKGFAIVDNRPYKKKSHFGELAFINKFTNPSESGFYPYVTKTGELRYGFMLVRPIQLQEHFATDDTIVIDLDSSEKGVAYVEDTKKVFVKEQIKVRDYSEVHKMAVDPAEGKPGYSHVYVLINENLKATQAFRINSNFKDASGIRRLSVEPYSVYESGDGKDLGGRLDRPGSVHQLPRGNYQEHPKKVKELWVVITKRTGDKLEYRGDTLYVPSGFKLLQLKFDRHFHADYSTDESKYEESKEKSRKAEQRYLEGKPGSPLDLSNNLIKHDVRSMTVQTNGSEYFVNLAGARKKYEDPISAKIAMTIDLGMDFDDAEKLIDSLVPGTVKSGHIKLAFLGDVSPQPFEETPYSNELGQTTYTGVGQENMLPNDNSYTGNPTQLGLGNTNTPEVQGVDPRFVNQAIQLAQNGQKEIFDAHMMSTLAKYVSVSDKISEYLPSFVEAMDRLGRVKFLLHWETDKFEEMYGKGDLPELVELVTSVLKNLGDLVIFLKRKSPELSINMSKDDLLDM